MSLGQRFTSLRVRIALGIGVLSAAVVALAFLGLQAREKTVRRRLIENQVERQSQLILAGLEHRMLEEDPERRSDLTSRMISRLVRHPEVRRIDIFDKDGVIRTSSDTDSVGRRLDTRHPTCQGCHATEPTDRSHFAWIDSAPAGGVLRHATPIPNRKECRSCHDGGNSLNGLMLAEYVPFAGSVSGGEDYAWLLALLALGGGLTGFLAFFLVDALVTQRLGRFVERIRPGSGGRGRAIRTRDEITRLEHAFGDLMTSLEQERNHVIRQEKLASLGELAGSIAHEINNPIGIILSHVECLRMEASAGAEDREIMEDIEVVERHTRRIASTVSGLLSFSRQAPGTFESVDLNMLVADLLEWVTQQYQDSGMSIVFEPGPRVPRTRGIPVQLTQVLLNLLNNARDAMPGGGCARLQTRYDERSGGVCVTVTDEGPGVRRGDEERVFEPFFTTKRPGAGTGLGLSVCHRIVRAHAGRLSLRNGAVKGAVFEVWLPAHGGAQATPGSRSGSKAAAP